MDTPPVAAYPNGFSARWESFLITASSRLRVRLFGVRHPDAVWTAADFHNSRVDAEVSIEAVSGNPLNRRGPLGQLRRLGHYAAGGSPYMAHPRRFVELEGALARERPDLLVSFLASTSQVHRRIPDGLPFVAVLEEAFDKVMLTDPTLTGRFALAARREARLLQRFYRQLGKRADRVVVISAEEKHWLSGFIPPEKIDVVTHAVDCSYYAPVEAVQDIDIMIVGDLSQARNYRPARALYDRIQGQGSWSRSMQWAFVGRAPHSSISELNGPGVTVTGSVPDVRPYYARSKIIVSPTLTGSGVKTTVLQSWAMGKCVVSTPFSATGLEYSHGREILIGDDEAHMCREILDILGNAARADTIGKEARLAALKRHDIGTVAGQFVDLCESVRKRSPHG